MNIKHRIDLSKFITEINRSTGLVYIKLPAQYKNDGELINLLNNYHTKSIEQQFAAEDAALDAQWEEKSRRRR